MVKKYQFTFEQIKQIESDAHMTESELQLCRYQGEQSTMFIDGGKIKTEVTEKKIQQSIAFIDWLNFTVKEDSFAAIHTISDNDLILNASLILERIFGFPITTVRPNGAFFYKRSFELGDNYGLVCHGGQMQSLLVSINGTGLANAKEGWENRLYKFLKNAVLPNITRIDLAHDDFSAQKFNVDFCLSEFMRGSFTNGKKAPSISQAGNWILPDGKGRTLYIGKRTNGLFCRVYEKGLQLESVESPNWVRCEIELKSTDRIIPLDVLLKPHHYFAGSFPIFHHLHQNQIRVLTFQHEVKSDINHRIKWGRRQTGSLLKLLEELHYTNDEIVELLKNKQLPKSFKQKFLPSEKEALTISNSPLIASDFFMGVE